MKVCFNGCSFTVGEGFPEQQRDQYIYDRLLSQRFNFESTNVAVGGSSNYTIFMRSAAEIVSNKYDLVFTQWTALNRVWFYPGPDTEFFTNDQRSPDYNYRDLYLNTNQKKTFCDTILLMNHDYNNILELVDYCTILTRLAELNSTKLVFINGILPWQDDLSKPLGTDLSSSLSAYTKSILDFENRSDDEIIKFFTKLQTKFTKLDQSLWANLFTSFAKKAAVTDTGPLGHHPGIASHQWMANTIAEHMISYSMIEK